MNTAAVENFIKNNAKNEEQAEALRINLTFKHNPNIRNAFGSGGAYLAHVERPEESPLKISDKNGRTEISRNSNRKMSPLTEEDINKTWKNDAQIRCEFGSFDIYKAYVEATVTGKCKTFRAVA
jgi:hypothetical protein